MKMRNGIFESPGSVKTPLTTILPTLNFTIMIIERSTKERFVKMLEERQIIAIQANKGANRKTYDYKIIGANNSGKWDFTPMCAQVSNYPNNGCVIYLAIQTAHDAEDIVDDVLKELAKEGIFRNDLKGWDLHEYSRDHITTFYI